MSSRFSDRQNHFLHLLISTKKKKAACFNKSLKNQHFKYELLFFLWSLCPWPSYLRHYSNGFCLIVATALQRLPHLAFRWWMRGGNEHPSVVVREQRNSRHQAEGTLRTKAFMHYRELVAENYAHTNQKTNIYELCPSWHSLYPFFYLCGTSSSHCYRSLRTSSCCLVGFPFFSSDFLVSN